MKNGTHKTWLLLRGLTREKEHWGRFLKQMEQQFPEDRVCCVDLPGAGEFYRQTCPLSIREMTPFIRPQAQNKGFLEQPVHLVGMSLGGMIAMEWMTRYTSEVAAGVVINTSANSPFYKRLRIQVFPEMVREIFLSSGLERERAIVNLVLNNVSIREEVLSLWVDIAVRRPVSRGNSLRQFLAATFFRLPSVKPVQPVLILAGKGDRFVSSDCSQDIARAWGLNCHLHEWGGHDLTTDDPEWITKKILDWA